MSISLLPAHSYHSQPCCRLAALQSPAIRASEILEIQTFCFVSFTNDMHGTDLLNNQQDCAITPRDCSSWYIQFCNSNVLIYVKHQTTQCQCKGDQTRPNYLNIYFKLFNYFRMEAKTGKILEGIKSHNSGNTTNMWNYIQYLIVIPKLFQEFIIGT